MIGINNEIELLLSCSKPRMDSKSMDRTCRLLQDKIDWKWVLEAARFHGVLPIMYHNLKAICLEAVPFKGPSLAHLAYGDVTLRQFSDLDIMVHKCDVLKAKNLMRETLDSQEVSLNSPRVDPFSRLLPPRVNRPGGR